MRLLAYGAAGVFVGWLSESRIGLAHEVEQRDRTLAELRTIQETLSPPEPEARPGLRLATCYLPAQDGVAGDFYLVTKGMGDSTVIAIGDVAGRGLEAAKRAWFVRTVLASSADFTEDPAEMLDLANYSLIEESGASSLFVTAACIVFHPEDRTIRWAVAGHEPPLHLDRGDPLVSRPSSGIPLGIDDNLGCATASSSLDLGSGLLLYTDGVIEARGSNGRAGDGLFGDKRLSSVVAGMDGSDPAEVIERVRDEVLDHAGGTLEDDVCLVALRVSSQSDAETVCDPEDAIQTEAASPRSVGASLDDRLDLHLARREVRADLALDALQRVVDRLGVALEPLADHLVGVPVQIERQDPALEVREHAARGTRRDWTAPRSRSPGWRDR